MRAFSQAAPLRVFHQVVLPQGIIHGIIPSSAPLYEGILLGTTPLYEGVQLG